MRAKCRAGGYKVSVTVVDSANILKGEQLIGAVSLSGAPAGDKDAACATAGLAKVADKLK
jgi:uncharacterized protein GlcG (DUF336 family)